MIKFLIFIWCISINALPPLPHDAKNLPEWRVTFNVKVLNENEDIFMKTLTVESIFNNIYTTKVDDISEAFDQLNLNVTLTEGNEDIEKLLYVAAIISSSDDDSRAKIIQIITNRDFTSWKQHFEDVLKQTELKPEIRAIITDVPQNNIEEWKNAVDAVEKRIIKKKHPQLFGACIATYFMVNIRTIDDISLTNVSTDIVRENNTCIKQSLIYLIAIAGAILCGQLVTYLT